MDLVLENAAIAEIIGILACFCERLEEKDMIIIKHAIDAQCGEKRKKKIYGRKTCGRLRDMMVKQTLI
jgi:hypothetical protein